MSYACPLPHEKPVHPSHIPYLQIHGILKYIDSAYWVDDMIDGFFEDLYQKGYTDQQLNTVLDVGLAEYNEEEIFNGQDNETEVIGKMMLTKEGRRVLKNTKKAAQ